MATKARLILLDKHLKGQSIMVYYDGYPEHTGELLKSAYNTQKQVELLMNLGNSDRLEFKIKDMIQLNQPSERVYFLSYYKKLIKNPFIDYIYIFKQEEEKWYLLEDDSLVPL